jgi:hypothetical protein
MIDIPIDLFFVVRGHGLERRDDDRKTVETRTSGLSIDPGVIGLIQVR